MPKRLKKAIPGRRKIAERLVALSTAAFGLVAALAWNSAIQELFAQAFGEQTGLWAKFIYAMTVTVIAVAVTYWIMLLADKE